MSKSLVIVESLAKARTINKYLGNDYIVKSSIGHIRDLSTKSKVSRKKISLSSERTQKSKIDKCSSLANRMGVNPWDNWQANYEILPGKEKIIEELKQFAKEAEYIYLATDLDREGEAIAWHLQEVIGGDRKRYKRVVFNEITKNAILQAFKMPVELNFDRINAQQARRFMDRIVGYMVSPLLWKKIARGLSAGRVQSVAVRLIVEREQKIKSFVPKEYWEIKANVMTPKGGLLTLKVTHFYKKTFQLKNRDQTMEAVALLEKASYKVLERKNKRIITHPSKPFITSTLQQAASTILNFSVQKTMTISQLLYESGYITYMRTDSTNLSQDSINMARDYIKNNFGENYLPKNAYYYTNSRTSQEAHEAIRPTEVSVLADSIVGIENDVKKLYHLIWCQFIACQMMPVEYDSIVLIVSAGDFLLKTSGHILHFDGWTKTIPLSRKFNNCIFTETSPGDELSLIKLSPEQNFTNPPPRFTEALLVKEMEKRGIGRPSTYALIISTIQKRGYTRVSNRKFYAEKIGEIVTNRLKESFCELMSYDFTSHMENNLDQIANHKIEWKRMLDSFFVSFMHQLEKAEKDPKEGGMQLNVMVIIDINCPTCNRKMGIRTANKGVFLACSGYTFLSNQCKTTINLIPENEAVNILERDPKEIKTLCVKQYCKKCNTIMDSYYLIDLKCKLYVCGNNPICDGYEIKEEKFHIKECENLVVKCEKCNSIMCLKVGRFGKYMDCTNKSCKNIRNFSHSGEIFSPKFSPILLPELLCEKSNAYFILRDSTTGIFLSANTFPKSRETRLPLVEELYRFRDRLPKKLHYLANAPQKNPEGNKTVVRFSRKNKQYYISAEKDGKKMGWLAFFINGKWLERKRNVDS